MNSCVHGYSIPSRGNSMDGSMCIGVYESSVNVS